jgi:hypothetical protein
LRLIIYQKLEHFAPTSTVPFRYSRCSGCVGSIFIPHDQSDIDHCSQPKKISRRAADLSVKKKVDFLPTAQKRRPSFHTIWARPKILIGDHFSDHHVAAKQTQSRGLPTGYAVAPLLSTNARVP